MDLPGYDEWKLQSPEDERRGCPFCGALSHLDCELEDGVCEWEAIVADPDDLRDHRDDLRLSKDWDVF